MLAMGVILFVAKTRRTFVNSCEPVGWVIHPPSQTLHIGGWTTHPTSRQPQTPHQTKTTQKGRSRSPQRGSPLCICDAHCAKRYPLHKNSTRRVRGPHAPPPHHHKHPANHPSPPPSPPSATLEWCAETAHPTFRHYQTCGIVIATRSERVLPECLDELTNTANPSAFRRTHV